MKSIYFFAAVLAVLVFSACSNEKDENNQNSDIDKNKSSSSNSDKSSSSNLGKSSSSNSGKSSNSNSGTDLGGCLIKRNGVNFQCLEENQYFGEEFCSVMGGEWVNSCPPGGTICEVESSGIPSTSHFYDEEHNPCSSLYSSSSIITNTPSSSSVKPSSSSGSTTKSGVCYFKDPDPDLDWEFCQEDKTGAMTQSRCAATNALMENYYVISFKDSCPSGYKYECEYVKEYIYFYGEDAEASDCELFED